MSEDFVSAQEAADLLGVKVATVYAYVSRGQIQSVPTSSGRKRLYRRADVEVLQSRRDARVNGGGGAVLGSALRWGEPVLDSSITEVRTEGPVYRGRSSLELARDGVGFEAVAELLWTGALPEGEVRWPRPGPSERLIEAVDRVADLIQGASPPTPPLEGLAILVPTLGSRDPRRYDRTPAAVLPRARRLIRGMADLLGSTGRDPLEHSIAEGLIEGVGARRGCAWAVDRLLVLWADHELNVSSFAARVVASTDADLYSCVSAGLAALSGPKHGGACEQIFALLDEIKRPEQAREVLTERIRRGDRIPGFGHPLYSEGDPRALPLLETARELGAKAPRVRLLEALLEFQAERGLHPTIDVGTIALVEALRVPRYLTPALIAVGRCAGWVAHVLEQYSAGFLIRPRARFRPHNRRP